MPPKRSVVQDFTDWARDRPGLEPDVVETLVDFKRTYLDDRSLTRWTCEQLEDLFMYWVPRKVVAPDEWVASAVPTMCAFIGFLRDTGRLHRDADPAVLMLGWLEDLPDEFAEAMRDPERFAANELVSGNNPDMLDFEDDFAGYLAGLVEDDVPPPLPQVVLPPLTELAAAARDSDLLRDVVRLALWLGEGRKTSIVKGVPRWARKANDELSLGQGTDPLRLLWRLAVESEIVDTTGPLARPGELAHRYQRDGDDDVLAAWDAACDAVLELGIDLWGHEKGTVARRATQEVLDDALVDLYAGHGVRLDVAVEAIIEVAEELDRRVRPPGRFEVGPAIDEYVNPLLALGAMSVDGHLLQMTPLGRWGYRQIQLRSGGSAPVLGDVDKLSPAALLDVLDELVDDDASAALEQWLTGRDRLVAARDLLEVASSASATQRVAAVTIVREELSDVADDAFAGFEGDALVGPYAAAFPSTRSGTDSPLSFEQFRSMGVDALVSVGSLQEDDPDAPLPEGMWDIAESLLDRTPPWPVQHPQAVEAYEIIAAGHPRGQKRKLAKKAIHQLRNPRPPTPPR